MKWGLLVLAVLVSAGSAVPLALAGNMDHKSRCTTQVHAGLPYDQWQEVQMTLSGGGDNFWITSPAGLAGHYLIQAYRFVYQSPDIVPGEDDPGWSPWYPKGQKKGPGAHSSSIECKGAFSDADPPYWIDSVDILLPAGR